MAVTYGFYNSLNKDRVYNAEQMSSIFNGIITDGVFASIGGSLMPIAGTGMQVVVKTGKCWFNSTWTLNDALLPLDIPAADVSLTRIDAVVVEINSAISTRANTIKVVKGTPSANPAKPALANTETLHQYALGYVTIGAGVTSITADKIEVNVGKTTCPFITSVLQQTDITDLFNQWDAEFNAWFANVQAQLSGNVAANLQRQIDELDKKINSVKKDEEKHLSAYTKSLLGLPNSAGPDDAFQALLIGTDSKAYRVTVKYPNGEPAVGFTVGGIEALPTTSLITDENGMVLGKSTNASPTITIAKKYDDVQAYSGVFASTGTITDCQVTLAWKDDPVILSSSKTIDIKTLSPYATSIDYLLAGGGGGGGNGGGPYIDSDGAGGAGGGGGGYASQGSIEISSGMQLKCIVGSGGKAGGSSFPNKGSTGGTTSISKIISGATTLVSEALGGEGGARTNTNSGGYSGSDGGPGGSGNGNGGKGGYAYYDRERD